MLREFQRLAIGFGIAVILVTGLASFGTSADQPEQVIKITAKKFEYSPAEVTVKKGVPVTLEFTSLDRVHGFNCPDLGIRTDIVPEKANRVHFVPQKAGTFEYHCDVFCGDGHEDMTGKIIVAE
jgi:cytochrome c oxidase subunit II